MFNGPRTGSEPMTYAIPVAATNPPSARLEEMRLIAQPPEYSPSRTDQIYRRWSIYLSIPLARVRANPNGITAGWIAIGLAGAACMLSPLWTVRIAGALLLEFSYLLDFVDGEVARITNRKSMVGGFLDLMGHALIKTALPLAVGISAFLETGSHIMLLAGAIGAVAIGVGDALRFHAACTSGHLASGDLERIRVGSRTLGKHTPGALMLSLFGLSYESPGLFALALLAAILNQLGVLAIYWAIGGSIWMCLRAASYSRRLRVIDRSASNETSAPLPVE